MISSAGALERSGVTYALHSDSPMAPIDPLLLAWSAITRKTMNGDVKGVEQRASLDNALRAITIDAAYVIDMEDEVGSIRPGKKADFTVLDRDPYQVGSEGLRDINIWGVVFEGNKYAGVVDRN